jgi:hypothetical protein
VCFLLKLKLDLGVFEANSAEFDSLKRGFLEGARE